MEMRTVAKEEIDRWCLSNERGLWREVHSISNTVTPQGSIVPQEGVVPQECVVPWQRQPTRLTKDKASKRRPWYQRQPRTWFKPVFNVLLFVRERHEAFIFIAIFAVIFGLAWWLTSWLFV